MPALATELNDILQDSDLLSASDLQVAEDASADRGIPLAEAAIGLGLVSEDQLYFLAADRWGMEYVFPNAVVDAELVGRFPVDLLRERVALPMLDDGCEIVVAFPRSPAEDDLAQLEHAAGRAVRPVLASYRRLVEAQERIFGVLDSAAVTARDPSGVTLFFHHLTEAFAAGARELRFEPCAEGVRVLQRDASGLQLRRIEPRALALSVATRARALAQLPAEPVATPQGGMQHGALSLRLDDRSCRLRVALVPTQHGEAVILTTDAEPTSPPAELAGFGAEPHAIATLRNIVTDTLGSGRERALVVACPRRDVRIAFARALVDAVDRELAVAAVRAAPGRSWITLEHCGAVAGYRPDVVYVDEATDDELRAAAAPGRLLVLGADRGDPGVGASPFGRAAIEHVVTIHALSRLCAKCSRPDPGVAALLERAGDIDHPARIDARLPIGCDTCAGSGLDGTVFLTQLRQIGEPFDPVPLWDLVTRGAVTVQEVLRGL